MQKEQEREERIRQRAYEIWESEGRPEGAHDEHWLRAVKEIDGQGPASAENGASGKKPRKPPGVAQAAALGGLSTPLQSGGIEPGSGPGASVGSIGTGGGSTANRSTGAAKRGKPSQGRKS